ncbi:MAG: ABC-F family ATP-binding cassette domain-containing protein, partial [Oscillospiraceae bacterium]
MILLNADKISLSYTDKVLLNGVSLAANEGDKIGIIGVNGTGKSTFLKILAGKLEPEKGTLSLAKNISISYLPQNPEFDDNMTALEYVLTGFDNNKYPKEHEAMSVLNKMGVENYNQKLSQLSGGQKRRAAIAKALIFPCEILILDEPTNHLDSETANFLEEYLVKYKGAISMVTHDRYFLDRVSNRIVEIDGGNLYSYNTNYEGFLQAKSEREEMAVASERKRQSILRTELEWLKRGARARGTKSRYRIENIDKIKENALDINDDKLEISSLSSRLGKQIIEIENITKSYGETTYIKDFSYNLLRNDRIGIVGENGCGKSTLLKIIMGSVNSDCGEIKIGQTVKIGYFSQECDDMDINKRVIDYIKDYGEYVETKEGRVSASKLLETFLFPSTLQYSQISRLSGGERRRLYLLSILITAPNILLLDEPTNDLDITTLSILEDYIE